MLDERVRRVLTGLLWIYFGVMILTVGPGLLLGWAPPGEAPDQLIDWLAYRDAAQAVAHGASPYRTPEQNTPVWTGFHVRERELQVAAAQGRGRAMFKQQGLRPLGAPPYLYPPTLALLLAASGMRRPLWGSLVLLGVIGFVVGWLRSTRASALWLVPVLGSVDLFCSVVSGNIEVVLLALTLLAAWMLWYDRPLLAALPLAFVIAVKPFYALCFVALALLMRLSSPQRRQQTIGTLTIASGSALLLLVLDAVRWGPALWAAYRSFLRDGVAQLWLVLPLDLQTPLSLWNRTPTQAFVNAGLAPTLAVVVAPLVAGGCLMLTLWWSRRHRLGFPLAFALALVILYLGRPVGWGLLYLDLVVPVAVWPWLQRRERGWLLVVLVLFSGSHLVAYGRTLQGQSLAMMTLQSERWPLESWLVLPAAWLLLLLAVRRTTPRTGHTDSAVVLPGGGQ